MLHPQTPSSCSVSSGSGSSVVSSGISEAGLCPLLTLVFLLDFT